uniref:PPM-type phosphatase domain-containing protein n=1 Tax=Romanomermis culicivorax TaxID=13658 RepID=A0A915IU78_ROMCU
MQEVQIRRIKGKDVCLITGWFGDSMGFIVLSSKSQKEKMAEPLRADIFQLNKSIPLPKFQPVNIGSGSGFVSPINRKSTFNALSVDADSTTINGETPLQLIVVSDGIGDLLDTILTPKSSNVNSTQSFAFHRRTAYGGESVKKLAKHLPFGHFLNKISQNSLLISGLSSAMSSDP